MVYKERSHYVMYEYKTFLNKDGTHYMKKVREIPIHEALDMPKKIVKFFREEYDIDQLTEEYVYILAVNQSSKMLAVFELTHGTSTSSIISARDIFVKLCLAGATAFLMIHNHPGGTAYPSKEDMETTKLLARAGTLMDIPILDHIIIANGGSYVSLREQGMLKHIDRQEAA